MKTNMGTTDRVIRIALAAVMAVLYYTQTITGTTGIIMVGIAVIFVLTSLVSFCPLYSLLGINTFRQK